MGAVFDPLLGLLRTLDDKFFVKKTGDTITGGSLVVADTSPASKAYRFRTSGSNLDWEGGGHDLFLSMFANADFTGTQYTYMRLESGTQLVHAIGTWNFTPDPFSGAGVAIDGSAGTVTGKSYVQPGNATTGGGHLYSGSGAPNITGSVAGDYYFRTDTPTTANQRVYVATAGNTWSGIV